MNFLRMDTPNLSKKINVRTDPVVKEKLWERAIETGDSINKIINRYIIDGLKHDNMQIDKEI